VVTLKNPKTILIKNSFYPSGLNEQKVWEYYQKNKYRILKEVSTRDLMLAICVKENDFILKRAGKTSKYIKLSLKNYDEVMHGRVITIYSTMSYRENIAIVDIDIDDLNKGKRAAFDVYKFVMTKIPIVKSAEIRFTGKQAFHIVCELKNKYDINDIRITLKQALISEPDIINQYTVEQKRTKGIPNLDLSPNKKMGAFITKYSLSTIGLQCMEIPINRLNSFNKTLAKI